MKKILIIVFVIIMAIVVIFLLVKPKENSGTNIVPEDKVVDGVREITINAKRFEYNPNVIKVKEGERIRLKINNIDGEHGFSIPELGLEVHDEDGVEFVANKGRFDFYCHHYCGEGHAQMKGEIIVE